ncbi:MAG: hypothetical protein IH941_06760 [Acidobacteria bacterium]|nr:hypothetical protein [Acidobacteriota bacterium]
MTIERAPDAANRTVSPRQGRFVSSLLLVLVYLTVLNLFVEYWDRIVIDSFTISVVTAALITVLFKATLAIEHRISGYFKARPGAGAKVLRFFAVWGLLISSKFVILEVVDIVFGEHVDLGGFLPFILLAVSLLVAELIITRTHQALA